MYEILTDPEELSKIRAVFVDVDNTLLDFDAYVRHTMQEGFEHFGLRPYEAWMYPVFLRINNQLWRQIEMGTLTFEELQKVRWNRIFEELGIHFPGLRFERFFRDSLFTSAIPRENALQAIRELSKHTIVCAASNGPYRQQCNRLRLAGMLPYMTDVYVSERLGVSKPAPEFFLAAAELLNRRRQELGMDGGTIRPEEILMIGDSLTSDMDGGIAAGMKTCLYTGDAQGKDPEGRRIDVWFSEWLDILNITKF